MSIERKTQEFMKAFNRAYPHITHNLSTEEVGKWLDNIPIVTQWASMMDLFSDYLLSQGLCDVQE